MIIVIYVLYLFLASIRSVHALVVAVGVLVEVSVLFCQAAVGCIDSSPLSSTCVALLGRSYFVGCHRYHWLVAFVAGIPLLCMVVVTVDREILAIVVHVHVVDSAV